MDRILRLQEGEEVPRQERELLEKYKRSYLNGRKMVFVGVAYFKPKGEDVALYGEDITLYSLPKYYDMTDKTDEAIKKDMKTVCRVIEKLRSKGKSIDESEYDFDPLRRESGEQNVDRMQLAEYIINDYLRYGLYRRRMKDVKVNGTGKSSWGRTVKRFAPITDRNSIVYDRRITRLRSNDPNDIMTLLHANVVNRCIDFMKAFDVTAPKIGNVRDLGDDLSAYRDIIDRQMLSVFDDRTTVLFKAIRSWCGASKYYRAESGSTCFNKVWEWVNDAVWGNCDDKVSQPPTFNIGGKNYTGLGDQEVDTIWKGSCNGKGRLAIFDSKYYTAKSLENRTAAGLPANSDIVKQIAYYMFIKHDVGEGFEYSNAFLLPMNKAAEEKIPALGELYDGIFLAGFAQRGRWELLQGGRAQNAAAPADPLLSQVDMIFIRPERLYEMFLGGAKIAAGEEEIWSRLTHKNNSAELTE